MNTFDKVTDSSTVVQKITSQLMQQVIDGKLSPGQRLPTESEISEQLGVGRNSLREAMKILSAMGIVSVRRGDGTYINHNPGFSGYESMVYALMVSKASPSELLELRKTIETDVLELAAKHCDETDIVELELLLNQYHKALDEGRVDEAYELDIGFHMRIAQAGRNRLMARIFKTVLTIFFGSIKASLWPNKPGEPWLNRDHIAMLEALRTHDVAKCSEIVTRSVDAWSHRFEKSWVHPS